MTRINHDNLNDWFLWDQKKSLVLGKPNGRAKTYKLEVNSVGPCLVYIVLEGKKTFPLHEGTGKAEINFGIVGDFEIRIDSEAEVWFYNIGVDQVEHRPLAETFTIPHVGQRRDVDAELIAHKTAQNMMRVFQASAEEQRRRDVAREADLTRREKALAAKTSVAKSDATAEQSSEKIDTPAPAKGAAPAAPAAADG